MNRMLAYHLKPVCTLMLAVCFWDAILLSHLTGSLGGYVLSLLVCFNIGAGVFYFTLDFRNYGEGSLIGVVLHLAVAAMVAPFWLILRKPALHWIASH
jgi:hypothetical protein